MHLDKTSQYINRNENLTIFQTLKKIKNKISRECEFYTIPKIN
jgi:hypothetical protein